MSQRLFARNPGVLERGEIGIGAGEHDGRGVLRRLRAATHRTVLRGVRPRLRGDRRSAACQLSFGNLAAGRLSSSTAGAQRTVAEAQGDVSSSTAGAQRAVAEAQQDVSSSTAGAQRAVSPTSRPRSLSAPAGTRGRGPGGFTLGKNITGWRDGPMGRFVKPMSAAAASDGAEAIEAARRARDAQFSTKLSETLRKQRDESAGIKARTTLA